MSATVWNNLLTAKKTFFLNAEINAPSDSISIANFYERNSSSFSFSSFNNKNLSTHHSCGTRLWSGICPAKSQHCCYCRLRANTPVSTSHTDLKVTCLRVLACLSSVLCMARPSDLLD